MSTLFQVGAGSGGMVVLDLLCREPSVQRIVLLDPDVYKSHNVHRHYFGTRAGRPAQGRTGGRMGQAISPRPGSRHPGDRSARPVAPGRNRSSRCQSCDIGVCAVDNEPAKYHFDALMRKHAQAVDARRSAQRRHRRVGSRVPTRRGVLRLRGQPFAADGDDRQQPAAGLRESRARPLRRRRFRRARRRSM